MATITAKHRYAHDVRAVFALFSDADEIEAKQKALGARKIRVLDCESSSAGARVRFVRELPATVPDVLQRFLQPWNRVEQAEQWRTTADGFVAELTIDIANVPVKVSGTLRLKSLESGCVNDVHIDISCGIPFLGKTLAEFVAADCKRLIAGEYDYITGRLES